MAFKFKLPAGLEEIRTALQNRAARSNPVSQDDGHTVLPTTIEVPRIDELDVASVPVNAVRPALDPLARLRLEQRTQLLRRLLLGGIAALLLLSAWVVYQFSLGAGYINAAAHLQTLSQRIAKAAQQVQLGSVAAVAELRSSQAEFSQFVSALSSGGEAGSASVPATSGDAELPLGELRTAWEKASTHATAVISSEERVRQAADALLIVNKQNGTLLELTEQVQALKLQGGGAAREVALAAQLVMLSQRIAKNANAVVGSAKAEASIAELLEKDAANFVTINDGLISSAEATRAATARDAEMLTRLRELQAAYKDSFAAVQAIVAGGKGLEQGKQATRALIDESSILLDKSSALFDAYQERLGRTRLWFLPLALIGIGLVALLLLLFRQNREDERLRVQEAAARGSLQEDAILQLMNDMQSVAEGDLTVRATVTDDVTGAIADSVNFTVEELSRTVAQINVAAEQMATAATSANQTSGQLLVATESQSEQIRDASESVLQMTRAIEDVSNSAAESATVARQSLTVAEQGAMAVSNSISGMNEIRGQIQDTAKRIKRLGESSQEIGEIVGLISDITERTQVLALNAAIQAAAAGEAGRGFTVVAEEVQRLAERSAAATNQIAAIVRTIQTDTQDAVAAMERSTQQVIEGARLSDAAGSALAEIGDVSRRLAVLIQGISQTTQDQVKAANQVATGIQNILAINRQTNDGTRETAQSIEELATLASLVKDSVASFKLA